MQGGELSKQCVFETVGRKIDEGSQDRRERILLADFKAWSTVVSEETVVGKPEGDREG